MNRGLLSLPVLNLSLRSASLCARFALTLFMAKFLTLEEIGLFGLFYSATAAAPAVLGLGMNFFLNRELIKRPEEIRLNLLRDRLVVSAVTAFTVSMVILAIAMVFFNEYLNYFFIFFFIFIIEVLCLDLHFSLLILKKPLQANYLLFIRSALWVFPFVIVSYLDPSYRNLIAVMFFWLGGLIFSIIATVGVTKNWNWVGYKLIRFDSQWFKAVFDKNKLVYASDIGIAGAMFADRFVLGGASDLQQVGIFVFFWTVANAVQVLTSSGVSQIALPYMVEAFNKSGVSGVRRILSRKSIHAFSLASALSLIAFVIMYLAVPLLGRPELIVNIYLLIILLVTTAVRSVSDVWSAGLYSVHLDKAWAYLNLGGFFGMLISSYFGIKLYDLAGLASAILAISVLQLFSRVYVFAKAR